MIKAQGGDAGDRWLGHEVRAVIPASETDFEDGNINLEGWLINACGRGATDDGYKHSTTRMRDMRQALSCESTMV